MQLKKIVVGALMVLALGGVGAGVASAASPTTDPPVTATAGLASGGVDTPEPGDTADPAGAADTPDAADSAEPTGGADTDNVQHGDQNGPDTTSPTSG